MDSTSNFLLFPSTFPPSSQPFNENISLIPPSTPAQTRCPTCHSKKFYKRDGMLFCDFGHQMQGYAQESFEFEATSSRRLIGGSRRKGGNVLAQKKRPKTDFKLQGDEGKLVAYQALQYMLKEFVRILIEQQHFPSQLETICRELCLMLFSTQSFFKTSSESTPLSPPTIASPAPSSSSSSFPSLSCESLSNEMSAKDSNNESDVDLNDNASSQIISDVDDNLSNLSSFATKKKIKLSNDSSSESSAHLPLNNQKPRSRPGRKKLKPSNPHAFHLDISQSLMIIYVGCLFLKIPLFIKDLVQLCTQNILPYCSAVYTVLPKEMALKIPQKYINSLHHSRVPKIHKLNDLVIKFVTFLGDTYQIRVPPLAFEAFAFRLTLAWDFPFTFYTTLLDYLKVLNVDGRWQDVDDFQKECSESPEIRFVAVALKLILCMPQRSFHVSHRIPGVCLIRYPDMIQFAKYEPFEFASFFQSYKQFRQHKSIDILRSASNNLSSMNPTTKGWLNKDEKKFQHVPLTETNIKMAMAILTGMDVDELEEATQWVDRTIWERENTFIQTLPN